MVTMRYLIPLAIVLAVTACTTHGPVTADEALETIEQLDTKYNTSYKDEILTNSTVTTDALTSYINDVQVELQQNATRHGKLLLEARKQMLESQYLFRRAESTMQELGGMQGWTCQDGEALLRAMEQLRESSRLGVNATNVFDVVLTENESMQERIGIGDEKPAFYNSPFNKVRQTADQGSNAYRQRCTEGDDGRT